MNWRDDWNNPTMRQRIKPFWFWNGEMKYEEIDHQLQEMKEKGLGGAFICARQGLRIPYLNRGWFDTIQYACQRGKEYGLEIWLYDEYPYPSGVSGGEVMLENPDCAHTKLHHEVHCFPGGGNVDLDLAWGKVLYAKAVSINPAGEADWNHVIDLKKEIGNLQKEEIYQRTGLTSYNTKRYFTYQPSHILCCQLPKECEWRVEIYTQEYLTDFKYYGNYFDPCDENAVKVFLETTHERYKEALGDEFGTSVFGMFSDETGFLSSIPWSRHLPAYFRKRYEYDVLDNLPALHDATYPCAKKIRYQFYQAAHELLRSSYHKQCADWCNNNNLMYTTEVPSMRRSTQIYNHVIGGDCCHEKLGKPLDWIYSHYYPAYRKNMLGISSVARQLGQDYAMIESFHSVGWSMTLQDAKWMFDLMASQGINFFNVHAFYYTIDSITKHDAPPSQFLQNPYWKHYKILADYAGRLSAFVSDTEAIRPVALLDPVTTFWTHLGNPMYDFSYEGNDDEEKIRLEQLKSDWCYLAKLLSYHGIGFDFLDTELLQMGEVKNGKIHLGKAEYSVIVLPPMTNVEGSVIGILRELVATGGTVIGTGLLPYEDIDLEMVEKEYRELFQTNYQPEAYWSKGQGGCSGVKGVGTFFIETYGTLQQAGFEDLFLPFIRKVAHMPVQIDLEEEVRKEIYAAMREDEDGELYVLLGNHGNIPTNITMNYDQNKYRKIIEMNLTEGEESQQMPAFRLAPYETKLLRFEQEDVCDIQIPSSGTVEFDATQPMAVSIEGDNIFRLDTFEVSMDQQEWRTSEVTTFVEMCSALQWLSGKNLKFESDFGTPKKIHIQYPAVVYYRQNFLIEEYPKKMKLLMDQGAILDEYTIFINGHTIGKTDFCQEFVNDHSNQTCDILPFVVAGKNEIYICVQVNHDWDGIRDPIYLIGDFGVRENHIVSMPKTAKLSGTYVEQFPYYSGTFHFSEQVILSSGQIQNMEEEVTVTPCFESPSHECVELYLNEKSLGVRAFAPYIWKCKKVDWRENNQVEIRMTNTLIHMLEGSYFDYDCHNTVRIE